MLIRERTIDTGIVVKNGTYIQKGIIRTRKDNKALIRNGTGKEDNKDRKNEVVIEANGLGFAIDVLTLLDFLKEARII